MVAVQEPGASALTAGSRGISARPNETRASMTAVRVRDFLSTLSNARNLFVLISFQNLVF